MLTQTDSGTVRGIAYEDHLLFQGIPYAAPPTGELRWRLPRPVAPWHGVRDATKPAPICVQDPHSGTPGIQSEDCLYLNVTAPRRRSGPRPVLVWLHGGGFMSGAGGDYDPRRLAVLDDIVVVTVNYRLGAFGFLSHPELPAGSGAFGLADQQAALHWVRRNAAFFGGDPANVTLAGESAGAMSVSAHLVSPTAAGLFHRAIMQSGSCLLSYASGGPFRSAQAVAETYRELVGQNTIDALRRLPAQALLEPGRHEAAAAFGNDILPDDPAAALRAGAFHRVPALIGMTRDEGRSVAASLQPRPVDETDYRKLLFEEFGDDADRIADRYRAFGDAITDGIWARSTHEASLALAKHVPTYAYEFADRNAPNFGGLPEAGIPLGAFHGSEVPYLLDITDTDVRFSDDQRLLSERMLRYWSRFAWSGDPNGPQTPTWQQYRSGATVQSLGAGEAGVRPIDFAAEHDLTFWG